MTSIDVEDVKAKMSGRWPSYLIQFTQLMKKGNEWRGPCALHGGDGPNLAVNPETGTWFCHSQCRRGGDTFSFMQELKGWSFAEALEDVTNFAQIPTKPSLEPYNSQKQLTQSRKASLLGRVVAEYTYTDENNETLSKVVRYDPKDFRQYRPDSNGGWISNMDGVRRVLFKLPEILEAREARKVIHIVEGEKDVLALRQLGLPATCISAGGGKWNGSYSECLRGATVAILPDNDDIGRTKSEDAATSLLGTAASVRVVELPDLPPGGDVSDWLDAGGTREELIELVRAAPPWTSKQSLSNQEVNHLLVPRISRQPKLGDKALYGLAGDIVRTIEPHTEADPAALLIQFLVAFGSVIGRSAHFRAEADDHYCNLFAVLVGQSSKARKGTSWGYIRRLFERVALDWAKQNIVSGLSSGEGLIHAVRDGMEKDVKDKETGEMTTIVIDAGVEDKRLLVQESEFASVLKVAGRDGNTLSAILRGFWDSGDAQTMTKREPARATGAHVSIVGHITREELRRDLSATDSLNGFGNRFLWCFVCRSKKLPEGGNLDDGKLSPLVYRLNKTVEAASRTRLMKRDENARELWGRIYDELSEGKPGLAGAVTSRAEAQVMRLATLYALLDCDTEVRPEHLMAAITVWEYAEASASHIFGDSLGDPVADEILDKLRDAPNGLTRTAIRDVFHKNQTASRIRQALSLLAECGKARYQMTKTSGKSAETWFAVSAADYETTPGAKA